jgi:hypothetical protein
MGPAFAHFWAAVATAQTANFQNVDVNNWWSSYPGRRKVPKLYTTVCSGLLVYYTRFWESYEVKRIHNSALLKASGRLNGISFASQCAVCLSNETSLELRKLWFMMGEEGCDTRMPYKVYFR